MRTFDDSSRLQREFSLEHGKLNGLSKAFYKNGVLKEEAMFNDGKMDGVRKYYYNNGKLWAEVAYKKEKPWTAISSYKSDGEPCSAGTLYKGNGTIHKILNYVNGIIDKGEQSE